MKQPYTTFWPGTPGGYVPVLADQVCSGNRGRVDVNAAAVRSRQTALARGHTGTIKGLSGASRNMAGDVSKALVSRRTALIDALSKGGAPIVNKARELAVPNGEKKYWNDAPCHAGHVGWRYTRSYACCGCMALSSKAQKLTPAEAME